MTERGANTTIDGLPWQGEPHPEYYRDMLKEAAEHAGKMMEALSKADANHGLLELGWNASEAIAKQIGLPYCESCAEADPTTRERTFTATKAKGGTVEHTEEKANLCDDCYDFAMDGLVAQAERACGWDPNP